MARRDDIGDGDVCPVVPAHGHMLYVQGTSTQWCPHQSHDGVWSSAGHQPPTRNHWPTGWTSFAAAVASYTASKAPVELPDIDLGGSDL